jgi:type II secretory pathway predicted ATPase ExeA
MHIDPSVISFIAIAISIGGVLIGFGVMKSKVAQNAEINNAQTEQIKALAPRSEVTAAATRADEKLTAAIKRSDEMMAIMTKRAEEDREKGAGQYREFYSILTGHAERIAALETQQNTLAKSLDEIKVDIKSGFKELQEELKELRKRM